MLKLQARERAALVASVEEHRVVFEVAPVRIAVADDFRTIGYDVLLLGTHERDVHVTTPGCEHCLRVWEHLARIAHQIIPERHQSTLEIQPYRPTLEYDSHGEHQIYVRLVIEIRHSTLYDSPADECELQCLGKIKEGMKALGIRQR